MSVIYRRDVFNAIIDTLLENGGFKNSYTAIYKRVKQVLGKKISHTDFSAHIGNMEKDGILCRNDPSGGRRGAKVFFSLSEYSKEKYNLGILKIDDVREKRKRLLRLLLCFHVYRRSPLLTEKQLSKFLKSIGGVSKKDLFEVPHDRSSPIDIFGNRVRVYECTSGIEIIETFVENAKGRKNITYYYPVIPGFSAEEFLFYAENLRNLTDPRPFSKNIPLIPYIRQDNYLETEVNDAIKYLLEAKIIRRIRPIFGGENRFDIVGQELKDFASEIWSIYQIDIHLVLGKILFIEKPSEQDKEYLKSYFGHLATEKVFLVGAHDYRRDLKIHENEVEKKRKNFFSTGLPKSRAKMVGGLLEKYKKLVEDEVIPPPQRVIHELVYDVLYPMPVYRI